MAPSFGGEAEGVQSRAATSYDTAGWRVGARWPRERRERRRARRAWGRGERRGSGGRGAEAEGVSGVSGREARGSGGRWRPYPLAGFTAGEGVRRRRALFRPGRNRGALPPHHLAGGEPRERIRAPAAPAPLGLSPTHPAHSLGLCASPPPDPPLSPLRSPLPARARRRSPSNSRPPCPDRPDDVPERLPAVDYVDYALGNEPSASAPASPSSSSTYGRRRSSPIPATPRPPRAHCHSLQPRSEPLLLLPLSVSSLALRSCSPTRARTPRRGARHRRVSGDQMVTAVGPLARPHRAAPA